MGRKSRDFSQRTKKGKGKASKVQPDPENIIRRVRPDIFKDIKVKDTRRLSKRIRKGVDKVINESKINSTEEIPETPNESHSFASNKSSYPRSCLKSNDSTGSTKKRVSFKDLPPDSEESGSETSDDGSTNNLINGNSEYCDYDEEMELCEDESEEEDLLPIEKQAERDAQHAEVDTLLEKMEIEDQMKDECKQVDVTFFDESKEITEIVPDLDELKRQIANIIYVLDDFKNRREEGRRRKEYRKTLLKNLCLYYSYNEFLMQQFMDLFPKNIIEFLESCETKRPLTIRTNTIKARRRELAQALISRGVNLDPLEDWSTVGLVVYESQIPIGATPEYFAGHYIIQGASSFMPVIALDPKPEERILDMCSAPGGKTTYIAALMKNTGTLYANDIDSHRCQAIVGNSHRLGVVNMILFNKDGRKIPSMCLNVDRVLLDAPCSGSGVISNDPSVRASRDEKDVMKRSHLQKELILASIDCCKPGGVVVYSTCSLLVHENEDVVQYALNNRKVRIVDTNLSIGENGFVRFKQFRYNGLMSLTRRFYPHVHNMDGFYVAKLEKLH